MKYQTKHLYPLPQLAPNSLFQKIDLIITDSSCALDINTRIDSQSGRSRDRNLGRKQTQKLHLTNLQHSTSKSKKEPCHTRKHVPWTPARTYRDGYDPVGFLFVFLLVPILVELLLMKLYVLRLFYF